MNVILTILNSLACLCVFWVCGTFMLVADSRGGERRLLVRVALLLVMAFVFVLGAAPLAGARPPSASQLGARVLIAAGALVLFDREFGIRHRWQCFCCNLRALPDRLRVWWHQRLEIAERHARSRRR